MVAIQYDIYGSVIINVCYSDLINQTSWVWYIWQVTNRSHQMYIVSNNKPLLVMILYRPSLNITWLIGRDLKNCKSKITQKLMHFYLQWYVKQSIFSHTVWKMTRILFPSHARNEVSLSLLIFFTELHKLVQLMLTFYNVCVGHEPYKPMQ